jgi:hypothetical protein
MDGSRFDAATKLLALSSSRRTFLKGVVIGALATILQGTREANTQTDPWQEYGDWPRCPDGAPAPHWEVWEVGAFHERDTYGVADFCVFGSCTWLCSEAMQAKTSNHYSILSDYLKQQGFEHLESVTGKHVPHQAFRLISSGKVRREMLLTTLGRVTKIPTPYPKPVSPIGTPFPTGTPAALTIFEIAKIVYRREATGSTTVFAMVSWADGAPQFGLQVDEQGHVTQISRQSASNDSQDALNAAYGPSNRAQVFRMPIAQTPSRGAATTCGLMCNKACLDGYDRIVGELMCEPAGPSTATCALDWAAMIHDLIETPGCVNECVNQCPHSLQELPCQYCGRCAQCNWEGTACLTLTSHDAAGVCGASYYCDNWSLSPYATGCSSDADCCPDGKTQIRCTAKQCCNPNPGDACTSDLGCCGIQRCCEGICAECCQDADCGLEGTCTNGKCTKSCIDPFLSGCTTDDECCDRGGVAIACTGGQCCNPSPGGACTDDTDCCGVFAACDISTGLCVCPDEGCNSHRMPLELTPIRVIAESTVRPSVNLAGYSSVIPFGQVDENPYVTTVSGSCREFETFVDNVGVPLPPSEGGGFGGKKSLGGARPTFETVVQQGPVFGRTKSSMKEICLYVQWIDVTCNVSTMLAWLDWNPTFPVAPQCQVKLDALREYVKAHETYHAMDHLKINDECKAKWKTPQTYQKIIGCGSTPSAAAAVAKKNLKGQMEVEEQSLKMRQKELADQFHKSPFGSFDFDCTGCCFAHEEECGFGHECCPMDKPCCIDVCTDIATDSMNCGKCGKKCSACEICRENHCVPAPDGKQCGACKTCQGGKCSGCPKGIYGWATECNKNGECCPPETPYGRNSHCCCVSDDLCCEDPWGWDICCPPDHPVCCPNACCSVDQKCCSGVSGVCVPKDTKDKSWTCCGGWSGIDACPPENPVCCAGGCHPKGTYCCEQKYPCPSPHHCCYGACCSKPYICEGGKCKE